MAMTGIRKSQAIQGITPKLINALAAANSDQEAKTAVERILSGLWDEAYKAGKRNAKESA